MEHPPARRILWLALLTAGLCAEAGADDGSLDRVLDEGRLIYGADAEGGGPYVYPDPADPSRVVGFEVELMRLLCGPLGPSPEFRQGQWDSLLPTLAGGHVDAVVNGYERTDSRTARYLATRPYYVFQLQLVMRLDDDRRVRSIADLAEPKPGGGRWRVAVLGGSQAETYTRETGGDAVEVEYYNGTTDCFMAVRNGQADATIQDYPAFVYYRPQYPELESVGPLAGAGHYVIYLRRSDVELRDALDLAIGRSIANGELEALDRRFGIWTEAQLKLPELGPPPVSGSVAIEDRSGFTLLAKYAPKLRDAAATTFLLAVVSMPLAMLIGLLVALGRLYGPSPLRWLLLAYVELIRGTPLMLQLFALYFMLPRLGLQLDAIVAAVVGLALNYSAYEAEIYRAGLLAIPAGQMEAALALGMSRRLAIRRILVPQAVRLVIPPVTNDFIALFKDTSVCSVISVMELTKQYSILANSTGGVMEFALATAAIYMLMSIPLAYLSRRVEGRGRPRVGKGALA